MQRLAVRNQIFTNSVRLDVGLAVDEMNAEFTPDDVPIGPAKTRTLSLMARASAWNARA
jgi:hypothetical protein